MIKLIYIIPLLLIGCVYQQEEVTVDINGKKSSLELTQAHADILIRMPLKCVEKEFPNKLGQVLNDTTELRTPKSLHPAFYGCFDWHSSVHGHWLIVRLLKEYPKLKSKQRALAKLNRSLTAENIKAEMAFLDTKFNESFERTYGWAWLLKLQQELDSWETPEARIWSENLRPLSNLIIDRLNTFLPKLNYPIRSGQHPNTAFGLSFALDYAHSVKDHKLGKLIKETALRFYEKDKKAPLSYEPSGFDFLSPSLCEAELMSKVLEKDDFTEWFEAFFPSVMRTTFNLVPGEVSDREDGKLVHLDGLNFSRAWCLYHIADKNPRYDHLRKTADLHLAHSLPSIVDGNYAGEHWLASFATFALLERR